MKPVSKRGYNSAFLSVQRKIAESKPDIEKKNIVNTI